nr:oligosaccharide flippase family protein [Chloroflexaceae bacterium]
AFSSQTALFGAFAGTSVLNYAFGLLMGWRLLPADFGLLAFAQTVLLVGGLVLNAGFSQNMAAALVREADEQRAALVRGAMLANMLLALAMGLGLLGLFTAGPFQPGFETPLIVAIVALTLPLFAWLAIVRATAQGLEHFGTVAWLQVLEVGGKVGGGLALVALGFGAAGAIAGFLVGGLLAAAWGGWFVVARARVGLLGPFRWPAIKDSGDLFGALLAFALLLNLDLLFLKLVGTGDTAVVGQYQAAIVLANTPYYLVAALLPMLFTRIARLGSLHQSGAETGQGLQLVLLFLVPVELVLMVAPELVLGLLFPDSYGAGAGPLRLLALGNCGLLLLATMAVAFQATRQAQVVGRLIGLLVAAEAVALWLVVPRWGALGAASCFVAATYSALAWLSWHYAHALPQHQVQAAWRWLARYTLALVAGLACGAAVAFVGLSSIITLLAGALVFALAAAGSGLVPFLPRLQARRM